MPRIPRSLIRQARGLHHFLPLVLREVRDLESARCELGWLSEHAQSIAAKRRAAPAAVVASNASNGSGDTASAILFRFCKQRSRGKPLQYILGSHPFGGVDIICRPGVLCPRSETEATVQALADILNKRVDRRLNIVDLCTGPGSVALSLARNLTRGGAVLGVDNSATALSIAKESLALNTRAGNLPGRGHVSFMHGDVLMNTEEVIRNIGSHFSRRVLPAVDLVFANPPYVSAESLWKDTSRSVRLFEPREALLPPSVPGTFTRREDAFYPAIERIASELGAKAIAVEIGDQSQAHRVKKAWESRGWEAVVWKDYSGLARNVVAWKKEAGSWSWLDISRT